MKTPNCSGPLAGVGTFSTYPPCHGNVDEEEEEDLCSSGVVHAEKKRRLRVEQVKALERSFEVENKLEPERKTRLAAELGLQPRQVAIWFQNRRARWKTKQLERDYGTLKESFDSLKLSRDALRRDNEALLSEISDLKAKLAEESGKVGKEEHQVETNHQIVAIKNIEEREEDEQREMESDSSDALNEENLSFCSGLVSGGELFGSLNYTSSSSSPWQCYEPRSSRLGFANHQWKVEEEMACSGFFSDEQTPPLLWYSSDQWTS